MSVVQMGEWAVRVSSPTGVRLSSALLQAKQMRMAWAEKVFILGLARTHSQSEWSGSKNSRRLDSLLHGVPSKQFSPVPGQQETPRVFNGLVMQARKVPGSVFETAAVCWGWQPRWAG